MIHSSPLAAAPKSKAEPKTDSIGTILCSCASRS
jgi:hypothetical protein